MIYQTKRRLAILYGRQLSISKTKPVKHVAPLRNSDGTWDRNNQQKADVFGLHLEQIFQPHDSSHLRSTVTEELSISDSLAIPYTSPYEIKKVSISSIKSPGFDLIIGNILKQLPKKALIKISHLINASFRLKCGKFR